MKACLVSMDSTLRNNLSVGLPVDFLIYSRHALKVGVRHRLDENGPYFTNRKGRWS
ncbi:MAG: hypothetical protein OSB69_19275 [Alphaproteobacteria bacterium]|nr:hypothetical protein [Alphaproteobacteria bacterium]